MSNRRTIGLLAKELGVGVETIRFYERKGLIRQPRKVDGPRHYDDRTLATLRYLRLAQQLGFSLREIQTLQGKLANVQTFCASLRGMVENKLKALDAEAREITRLRKELKGFLARCRGRDPKLPCPIVEELTHLDTAVVTSMAKRPS